jgi:hypothetical protein
MVLGYIAANVVYAAIANLYVYLAHKYQLQEATKGRYNLCTSATCQPFKYTEAGYPCAYMPVWCTAALILCPAAPFIHHEPFVAEFVRQESPDTQHHVIVVERQNVSTSIQALYVCG